MAAPARLGHTGQLAVREERAEVELLRNHHKISCHRDSQSHNSDTSSSFPRTPIALSSLWSFPIAAMLHAVENEIITCSMIPFVVLIPVDSEGKPMEEFVVRSILKELERAKRKRDWSIPYHQ